MKILLTDPFGAGHHLEYVSLLSEGLKSLGHQIYFFGAPALLDTLTSASLIQDGVSFDKLTWGPDYLKTESARIRFCQQAISNSLKFNTDVCHFLYIDHFIISAASSGILHNKSLAICATLHWLYFLPEFALNNIHKIKGNLDIMALRFLTKYGTRIQIHSEKQAAFLSGRVKSSRFDYIPYPVKERKVTQDEKIAMQIRIRSRFELDIQDVLLLIFGDTRFDKGADLAVKMLSHLPSQYHLIVAGQESYFSKDQLAELAVEHGVFNRLHFDMRYIPEDELPTYFCGCNIVLIPYRKRFAGQCGPLTIAASLGTKVVVPDLRILAETASKDVLGWFYPTENIKLMAQAVQDATNAPATNNSNEFYNKHSLSTFTKAVETSYLMATGKQLSSV